MEHARINGVDLEYEDQGSGEPLVLVHGSLVADTFAPLMAEPTLAGHRRLICYHRRGFAGSSHPDGPLSIAQQTADCRSLLRYLGVERAHLAGHSYGGPIVLQLALDAPDVVASLVLLEPALLMVPSVSTFAEAMGPVVQMYQMGDKAGAVDAFARWVLGPAGLASYEERIPGGIEQAVSDADTFFAQELPALNEWQFTREQAGRITQPALAVTGADSPALWAGWTEIEELVLAWLPGAEPFVLANATHALQVQNPREAAEGIAAFLARHPLSATVRA